MAQQPQHDPVEALLGAVLAGQESGAAGSGSGARPGPAPVDTAWALDIPRGAFVEINLVKVYKTHRLVTDKRTEDEGWSACSAINGLKRLLVQNPSGCDTQAILQYASALMLVRDHIAANPTAYVYGRQASPNIDYELYMTMALLAARDTHDALEARKYQTQEGYLRAYTAYMHAADVLDEVRQVLGTAPPPRDRLHLGNPGAASTDWLALVAPSANMSVATTIKYMELRAQLLRCEAYASAYRALELVIDENNAEELLTLDGCALFVAARFQAVAHALRRMVNDARGQGRIRMELYASLMAAFFKLPCIRHQAEVDIDLAEHELNALLLARAKRRLERKECPTIAPEEWAVAGPAIGEPLRTAMRALDILRARIETLISNDATGAFVLLDLVTAATEPLAVEEVDPSFPLGQDDAAPVPRFSLATLRAQAMQTMPELVRFLSLRTDSQRVLENMHASPSLPTVPHASEQGRNVADGIFAIFCTTLRKHENAQRRLLIQDRLGNAAALTDLLLAVYNLGNLAERRRWTQFAFAGEEPREPGEPLSPMAQEMQDIDAHLTNAAGYFAALSQTLDLPT
jgi:hypothetical protein